MDIKAVIFDCYGVFYIDPIFAYLNDPDSSPKIAQELHDLDKQMVKGMITKSEFKTRITKLFNLSEKETHQLFFAPSARNVSLLEYAQTLRNKYKVAMLSNVGSGAMDEYFTKAERKEYFDAVVLSGDVGIAKPDPRIFKLICKNLGVETHEAIMIDDLPDFCEGARAAGLQAIVYRTNEQIKKDLELILHASN